jgi:thiol-disulfide isomerase/thioredoxin
MPLSSRSLTFSALGLFLIAGCDRGKQEAAQPEASAGSEAPTPAPAASPQVETGMVDRTHKGSQLPEFALKDAAGREAKLSKQAGKPFLLNLWATWCAPCVAELPALAKLAAGGKVGVITVSQDLGQPEKVAWFLADHGAARLPGWLDPENDLSTQYGVQTLPTTIFYDAQGREVWRMTGGHDWGSAETERLLAEGS